MPLGPRRYTVEQFAELPIDRSARFELVEGLLVVSPKPARLHMIVIAELYVQLRRQLPASLVAILEIDVHLEPLPDVVRCPDLVIAARDILGLPEHLTPSSEVRVAVEVLSPGSARTDTVVKLGEYADAGIEHYWLIDPRPPVTATIYRLVDGHYQESQRAQGVFEVSEPCSLRVDLDALLPRRLR